MPQAVAESAGTYMAEGDECAFVHRRGFRTLRWSSRQLAELAFRFARELETRNIGKGDRVMLWGENGAECVAAFFGCMLRGPAAAPLARIGAPDFVQPVAAHLYATLIVCYTALAEQTGGLPH